MTLDDIIRVLARANPKRVGTQAHLRWKRYLNGQSVRANLANGVNRDDLRNDAKKGFIAIDHVGPAKPSAKKANGSAGRAKARTSRAGRSFTLAELNALSQLGYVFKFDASDKDFLDQIQALIARAKFAAEELKRRAEEAQRRAEEAQRRTEEAQRRFEEAQRRREEAQRRAAAKATPPDAHALLGLKIGATRDEIRAAFRRLVKTKHPDGGGDAAAFRDLVAARDKLLRALS